MKKIYILLFAILSCVCNATAQRLHGNVTDAQTGEPLIGATVYIPSLSKGTVTDLDGRYTLSLSNGNYSVSYSFMGYETAVITANINGNTSLNVKLKSSSQKIDEVVITSQNKQEQLARPEMGVEKLQSKTIKSVPVLLGETDVIKVMQLMPGVQAASEGSTGFSVRGGNPDQNLVLLDGSTIYNAGHFMGFFSVFNNDAVNDVKLYKGDIPASYGGRLSSLLEVNMKDGDKQRYHLNGGVGLISSRLTVDGPIINQRTSFLASARRTYFDLFLPFATNESAKESTIYFYDLNARISHTVNDNNHIFASAYLGRDLFEYPIAGMAFGNKSVSLRWSHIFNQRNYLNLTAHAVNSDYDLSMDFDAASKASLSSVIKDLSIRADFSSKVGLTHTLTYGFQLTRHDFQPGTARGEGAQAIMGKIEMPKNKAIETSVFIGNTETVSPSLTLRYGVRLSTFHNYGPTILYKYDDEYNLSETVEKGSGVYNSNFGLEPRFALSYMVDEHSSVKASYTRTYQYMQQASVSTSGTPMDVWYMSSPNVKPQLSDQVSLGYFHNILDDRIELSFETFYKAMENTIDFKDHPHVMLNKYLEGELRFGNSLSYGAEFMAKADFGRWNGWVSYTLSRADRKIVGVNDGKRYLSPYNHTHDASVVASYRFTDRISVSGNWVFISGAPTTFPVARYEVGGEIVPYYSSRNRDRMPNYHRLDLSLTIQCKRNPERRWQGEWVFSFYNAYNHHNTWGIHFERENKDNEQTYVIKSKSVYLFPIIPSVSYNFKF